MDSKGQEVFRLVLTTDVTVVKFYEEPAAENIVLHSTGGKGCSSEEASLTICKELLDAGVHML